MNTTLFLSKAACIDSSDHSVKVKSNGIFFRNGSVSSFNWQTISNG